MGGCVQVVCDYYTMLYKGLQHPWILESAGSTGTNPLESKWWLYTVGSRVLTHCVLCPPVEGYHLKRTNTIYTVLVSFIMPRFYKHFINEWWIVNEWIKVHTHISKCVFQRLISGVKSVVLSPTWPILIFPFLRVWAISAQTLLHSHMKGGIQ